MVPYELESSKMKTTLYWLDLTDPMGIWKEDISLKPWDYKASFPFQMQMPAKIINYPNFYFLDWSGSTIIEAVYDAYSESFKTIKWQSYIDPGKQQKIERKRLKKASKQDSKCFIF